MKKGEHETSSQFEAEDFDDYMINIIFDTFKTSLESLDSNYSEKIKKYLEEFKLLIKIIYFSYKLFYDKFTEGQQVYNVKFKLGDKLLFKEKLRIVFYLICKIVLPYLMNKINDIILKTQEASEFDSWSWRIIHKFFIFIFKSFDLMLKISEFGNFMLFLISGKFPSIWNRIFDLKYEYINPNQGSFLSFNFLMKKIIWNQLAKIILYFFNVGVGKSNLQSLFDQLMGIISSTDDDQTGNKRPPCPICRKPITMGRKSKNGLCTHVFCFYCITKYKQESDLCPV